MDLKDVKVLVTPTSYGSQDPALKTDLEAQVGEVIYNTSGRPLTSSELQDLLGDVSGMIAGLDQIDAEAIRSAPRLKVIARYGVGLNNVDLQVATRRGVVVTNTPGANAAAVADLTLGLILNLLRPIIPASQQTREGEWPRLKGYSLDGKTVGILGLGAIGKAVALRLKGFGCRILAYDLYPDEAFAADHGIQLTVLDFLLEEADVVSLHLPGTPDTAAMVDKNFLGKMKPGSWLVNTARGDLVDDLALAEALDLGHLRGAALDCFKTEPPGADHPLLKLENVIVTPHMGAHADSATNQMGKMALEDCLAVLRGEPARHPAN